MSISAPTVLSILIPTIPDRRLQLAELTRKLHEQTRAAGLENRVEIIHLLDHFEHTVGAKRNMLLERARGQFVAFVDDDDDISENYVPLICRAIEEHPDIDCVGIKATIFFRGRHGRPMVFSLRNQRICREGKTYLRPPLHLNPMRREIASRYRFEDISYSEDFDWAMRISRDRALRREHFVDEVIYYYRSRRHWFYQCLLDRSESMRRLLGLELANRVRVWRWIRSWFAEPIAASPAGVSPEVGVSSDE